MKIKLFLENQDEKIMVIMRGLPGSGKSTRIREKYPNAVICSADHFFINSSDQYVFNPKLIGQAHAYCLKKATLTAQQNDSPIVIDNTNTQKWEYQKYIDLANQYGYKVIIDDLFDSGLSDEELSKRNIHNVPIGSISKMRQRWEKS